jgi:hypothetical protein
VRAKKRVKVIADIKQQTAGSRQEREKPDKSRQEQTGADRSRLEQTEVCVPVVKASPVALALSRGKLRHLWR